MRRLAFALLLLCLSGSALSQSYEGVFQGKIVTPKRPKRGWLIVLSKNGFLRQVEVAKAHVEYDDDFPAKERRKHPAESLRPATIIRVTAQQGRDGEWHAKHILIVASREKSPQPDNTNPNRRSTSLAPVEPDRVKTYVSKAPEAASK